MADIEPNVVLGDTEHYWIKTKDALIMVSTILDTSVGVWDEDEIMIADIRVRPAKGQHEIERILTRVETGQYATKGRDFGRGMAHVAKLIRDVLKPSDRSAAEPEESTTTSGAGNDADDADGVGLP